MLENKTEQILNNNRLANENERNENEQFENDEFVQQQLLNHKRSAVYNTLKFHTVKNCLQSISGLLQVWEKQCELKHIEIISIQPVYQEIKHNINLLNNYLKNSQESSILRLCSLNQLITEVIQSQQNQLALFQIQLKSNLAENLPPILLDKQNFQQMLINCLDNSRESIKDKGQTDGCIVISTLFDEKQKIIHLLIEDNGIGLNADQQANFFSPYYTTKTSGSGLGTCFCQAIVQMHGGSISVTGQPGKGCSICIDLPL